jgi:putative ABC transport system permease protein
MDTLAMDLRYALRQLLRAPGFTLVAVLTLALGIGANTAIFSAIDGVMLKPLPYADPGRLVLLYGTYPQTGRTGTSLPDYRDWREQGRFFSDLAAFTVTSSNLATGSGEPDRVSRAITTANFFRTLGVRPERGRFFAEGEDRGGGEQVAVISHQLWQDRLGGAADAVGRKVQLHGRAFTVIGVAPPGFRFGEPVDVWTPLNQDGQQPRRAEFLDVVGRLAHGVTLQRAQVEMKAVSERLARQYPQTNATIRSEVAGLREEVVGKVRPALLAFMGAVGLVLLIACANVANLLLTRAAAREREIAVRVALGAGRRRILRQLVTESLLISALGAAAGVALAYAAIQAVRGAESELIPRFADVGIDLRVLGFTALLALVTGVLFGLSPAVQFGWVRVGGVLRGSRGTAGRQGSHRFRSALVAGEVALALMLLVGAGLFVRSFVQMQHVDAGFDPTGVLTAKVALPAAQYAEPARQREFYARLLERLRTAPGVTTVALGSNVPLSGGAGYLSFSVEGLPPAPADVMQDAQPFVVTPGYLEALRIPVVQGRAFSEQDHADAPQVALINRGMAKKFWGTRNPIGSRISFDGTTWQTVVGVVGDTRVEGLTAAPYAQVYLPFAQAPQGGMTVLARTTADPAATGAAVRQAVRALDPALPVYDVRTMEQLSARSVLRPRVGTGMLGVFAAIALTLAAIGIYGLIAYSVSQRTREIGVRLALGATPAEMQRLVLRQGMSPALAGVVIGAVGAAAATRWIRGMLYGVAPSDPATFAAVPLFLTAVALLACWIPARRATRVDPAVALRSE